MYKIEKGIPIPPNPPKGGGRNGTYAQFLQMQKGDSIYFEGMDRQRAYHKVYYAVKFHYQKPWKFTSRDEDGGARVWRIK